MTVDIKINAWSYPDGFGSIFQFTTGGSCCSLGQRVPGIWTAKDEEKILVSWDTSRVIPYDITLGKWYNLVISKRTEEDAWLIEVKIEGHGVFKENVEEPDQMPFENVHAEVGFGDPPANVEFRRLFARSLKGKSINHKFIHYVPVTR